MNARKNKNNWHAPIICFTFFFIIILILFLQFCYLSLSKSVYGTNMKEFAKNRNTATEILTAKRGTIYDVDGNVLAQNISSYTLIAYLDPSRTKDENNPSHVVDKEYTATKLASILGEDNYSYILERLNKNSLSIPILFPSRYTKNIPIPKAKSKNTEYHLISINPISNNTEFILSSAFF